LDHDAVDHGIREGNTNLDGVGTTEDGGFDVTGPVGRGARDDVRHEGLSTIVANLTQCYL
jgi:hypothetical protein